jgi:hypothetical protein
MSCALNGYRMVECRVKLLRAVSLVNFISAMALESPLFHECGDKERDLIRCSVQREMPAVDDVDFGFLKILRCGMWKSSHSCGGGSRSTASAGRRFRKLPRLATSRRLGHRCKPRDSRFVRPTFA